MELTDALLVNPNDTEQLPEEIDEPDEMEEQLDIEKQCE